MPPMPPGFFDTPKSETKVQKRDKKVVKQEFPKECDVIPPMLFMLPPPLKADLDICTKKLYEPKADILLKNISKLEGKSIEILAVEGLDEFSGSLYKVTYKLKSAESKFKVLNNLTNLKTIYTNSQASLFFDNMPQSF
jgi:hypothetical protein